jgi:hypothetical protein
MKPRGLHVSHVRLTAIAHQSFLAIAVLRTRLSVPAGLKGNSITITTSVATLIANRRCPTLQVFLWAWSVAEIW